MSRILSLKAMILDNYNNC